MTDRTFSIRTGLAASTVTPGNTPPEASLTTPVIAACANTADGRNRSTNRMADACLANPDDFTSLPSLRGRQTWDSAANRDYGCTFAAIRLHIDRRRDNPIGIPRFINSS